MKSDTDNGTTYTWVEISPEQAIVQLRNELNKTPKWRIIRRKTLRTRIKLWEQEV